MRELVDEGAALFKDEVEREGHEKAVRDRVRALAANGDLAMIGLYVNQRGLGLSEILLSPITSPEIDVVRGQIMGIRNLYHDLLSAGELEIEPMENPHIRDNNPFSVLTNSEDSPLEI